MADIENQEVMGKRDAFLERLKGKYPEKSFDDDEALYGQINDDYDDYDNQISGYKEREDTLNKMFTQSPNSAALFYKWREGGDPVVELIRQFGTDIKDAVDDPKRQEEIAKANSEFVERMAKEKGLEEEYQTNIADSLNYLADLQQVKGLTDEQVDSTMEFIINIVKDGVMGRFSPETIEMAMKALNYDKDVETASEEGEIRGRNQHIDETLRTRSKGDGIPNLGGKNVAVNRRKAGNSMFDLAQEAR